MPIRQLSEQELEELKPISKSFDVVISYPFNDDVDEFGRHYHCRKCCKEGDYDPEKSAASYPNLYLLQQINKPRCRYVNWLYCKNCRDCSPLLMPEDVGTTNYFPLDGRS